MRNLATPVEQILNLSNSPNPPTPHTIEDGESIERYEKRILRKHQEMKDQAKQSNCENQVGKIFMILICVTYENRKLFNIKFSDHSYNLDISEYGQK